MLSDQNSLYDYFVLILLTLLLSMIQWQKSSLVYTYGFTSPGRHSPHEEIRSEYTELESWYPLLQGALYFLPMFLAGLGAGVIVTSTNRKWTVGLVVIAASVTVGMSGLVDSLSVFILMRLAHGVLNAVTTPLAMSILADYFPPERRTFANSVINGALYAGEGIASLSIHLIALFGWRINYCIIAMNGCFFALMTICFVVEPPKSKFVEVKSEEQQL
jgi:MFS family permease